MSKFIIAEGNLLEGFLFHGPFDSRSEALEYEELRCKGFALIYELQEPSWPTDEFQAIEDGETAYRRDMKDAGRSHLLK